jgi:tetratricopeptide (TPR) repeat protein
MTLLRKRLLCIVPLLVYLGQGHAQNRVDCDIDKGLQLVDNPSAAKEDIDMVLRKCRSAEDSLSGDPRYWIFKGLAARRDGMLREARNSLLKARQLAPQDTGIAMQLAVTLERLNALSEADLVYQDILSRDLQNAPALLGRARVARAQNRFDDARTIYNGILQQDPTSTDARNGLASIAVARKEFDRARSQFEEVLTIAPSNADAKAGIAMLEDAYKYMAEIAVANRSLAAGSAQAVAASFTTYLNATDTIELRYVQNSRELQTQRSIDPTPLAKNIIGVAYRSYAANKLGWGVEYDYLRRSEQEGEHRLSINLNGPYAQKNRWFIGGRHGFPSPWENSLLYAGTTVFLTDKLEITGAGYYADEERGGSIVSYSLALGKQASGGAFYTAGTAYSPTLESWTAFGKVTYPIARMQELVAFAEHRTLGDETDILIGWRIYWK